MPFPQIRVHRINKTQLIRVLASSLLSFFATFSQQTEVADAASVNITYTLPQSGKVSMNIYNANGKIVRNLLNAASRSAGSQTEVWDGLDDRGKPARRGNYTAKLVETQGLKAEYQLTLGTSFKPGSEWQQGPGNHIGVKSLALDSTGLYIGAGTGENVNVTIKQTLDGSRRLWSAWPPEAWMGAFSLASMDGKLYMLQQNYYIGIIDRNIPNTRYQSVGVVGDQNSIGTRFDVLWPGDPRPTNDNSIFNDMDMAAYNSGGSNPQLVVSYSTHNTIRWLDPQTGQVIDSATITAPKGVAIDNSGNVLVISGDRVLQLSRRNKTLTTVVSGLTSPWRLDVDRSTGEIWLVEQGDSQQIKRFAANGSLLKTYGAKGGRQRDGLYNPESGFIDVNDIVADGSGGFIVAESSRVAPRRTAHFDQNGKLINEWYGGTLWTPSASPDPDNPASVWLESAHGTLIRALVDYSNKTWKVHSTYQWSGMANGLVERGFSGGGYNSFKVRKRNGKTYLLRDAGDTITVFRVDEVNWKLVPCVVANFAQGVGGSQKAFIWTDANGDGLPQENEYRRYNYGRWKWERHSLQSDADFNYFYYSRVDGKVYKLDVIGWNGVGAPIYRDLPSVQVFAQPIPDIESDQVNQNPNMFFARQPGGSVYGAFGINSSAWGIVKQIRMVKWDANGTLQWEISNHQQRLGISSEAPPVPGSVYAFKRNVGVTHDCIVATDFNGGWNGATAAITYVWDRDGLWIGGLFEQPNLTNSPLHQYTLSSDNGAGEIYTNPSTGEVLYFGGWENEVRVYKITGWDGWVRQSIAVKL